MQLDWENLPKTIGIVGSREFENMQFVQEAVYDLVSFLESDTTIVSGGAAGIDSWAYDAARFFLDVPPIELKPDNEIVKEWLDKGLNNRAAYAKAAFARNKQIVERVRKDDGIVFAFKNINSKTKGTDNTCDWCDKLYVPCIIFRIGEDNEWLMPITNEVLAMNKRWSRLLL